MAGIFDLKNQVQSMGNTGLYKPWVPGGRGGVHGGLPHTGANMGTQPIRNLGMPGGTPGPVTAGGGGVDPTLGVTGGAPYAGGGKDGTTWAPPTYGGGGGASTGGKPTLDNPDPSLGAGFIAPPPGGWETGGLEPNPNQQLPMPGPAPHPGMGNQRPTPRPPYVPGSNPATANQGYTAADFYNGKAGFGAGWSGAEKQEWLQNNMAPITGHNYQPDFTDFRAGLQNELAANGKTAMQRFKDNPMYGQLTAGTPGTSDASGPQGNYFQRNGFADRGAAQAATAANWQNPEWRLQQVLAGKISPTNNAELQAMLAAMPPEKRAEYINKMKALSPNLDPTYSGPVGSGIFGNGQ